MDQTKVNSNEMNASKKSGLTDKLGEAVEKIGTAIGQAAPALGKKVHDMGDKLEKTHKNPNHPDDGTI